MMVAMLGTSSNQDAKNVVKASATTRILIAFQLSLVESINTSTLGNSSRSALPSTMASKTQDNGYVATRWTLKYCHTRFRKGNRMHPICAQGSGYAHTVDVISEYPKQCINEIE
jgi:hypothetical protein